MAEPFKNDPRFPPTRWSALEGANTENEAHRLAAIENFLRAYYEPLKNYLRLQFHLCDEDAQDQIQEFILSHVIQRNLIARADRERGKFRNFVLQALNRFMFDHIRKQKAAKRGPGSPLESLDEAFESPAPSAAAQFDIEFACEVVQQAIARMRVRCEQTGRQDLWKVFYERVLCELVDGRRPLPLEKLVPLLGVDSPTQASNLLTTAKRMFRRVFVSVVRDYAAGEEEAESEIRELRAILSSQ